MAVDAASRVEESKWEVTRLRRDDKIPPILQHSTERSRERVNARFCWAWSSSPPSGFVGWSELEDSEPRWVAALFDSLGRITPECRVVSPRERATHRAVLRPDDRAQAPHF